MPARIASARSERTGGARLPHPVFLYAILFSAIFLLHAPLLRLPYFWDEAGYYIPAARDLLLTGSVIPHSTLTNAHPPLALAWLALWWKFSGYTPAVTRTAMLLVAALALTAVFRLAKNVANLQVAIAATICTALYPVFFAQSSMAHVDMAAAALSLWGLNYYFEKRPARAAVLFCLAVLAKETAALTPLALGGWELGWHVRRRGASGDRHFVPEVRGIAATVVWFLLPFLTLAAWYAYHYTRAGYIFGNPQFFQYNVKNTLYPLRIALSFLKRLWQVTGYMNLFLLTLPAAAAVLLPAQTYVTAEGETKPRPRIALPVQSVFAVVTAAHVVVLSVIGGAVLARYMLTVLPLVVTVCVSTLWRRVRHWGVATIIVGMGFVLALFVNPPYPFALEDNLAYRDYVLLHKSAANLLARKYASARVLTAWPATDELSRPYLGYTKNAIAAVPIEDFSAQQLMAVAQDSSRYDVALLFSTKYEPPHNLFEAVPRWECWQAKFFGYHRDVPPEKAVSILGGRLLFQQRRRGEWVAVLVLERAQNARLYLPSATAVNRFLSLGKEVQQAF